MTTLLSGEEKVKHTVSMEYDVSEKFNLFALKNIIEIEMGNNKIEVRAEGFGSSVLDEDLEYVDQNLSVNSILNTLLIKKQVPEIEDEWIDSFFLLDSLAVKSRFLFYQETGEERLYRLDIKQLTKENVNNRFNKVILDNDIIKIWTNKRKNINKISFVYKNVSYVIYIEDEK
ncbi:MAG: hypothetical protein CBE50_000315 [Flammeovirgaceae bacterium TMED290]|nr:MAG: hypothetical protein CBE50_000315 [Flammeovirgaceae bacterium TMED290]